MKNITAIATFTITTTTAENNPHHQSDSDEVNVMSLNDHCAPGDSNVILSTNGTNVTYKIDTGAHSSSPVLGFKASKNMNLIKRVLHVNSSVANFTEEYSDCFNVFLVHQTGSIRWSL